MNKLENDTQVSRGRIKTVSRYILEYLNAGSTIAPAQIATNSEILDHVIHCTSDVSRPETLERG